ncbi:MAG TPA: hypothetical protein VN085_11420, partial [Vicinamibacterales bacterium]|nr:hypothetical protein [Vicinamibacterales bacterium]
MRNRAIVHFLRLVAFILVFGGVSSRAEAAWPKTGDVLVLTRSFDPATATSYPYLVAVDPVTQDKTVIADLSLL